MWSCGYIFLGLLLGVFRLGLLFSIVTLVWTTTSDLELQATLLLLWLPQIMISLGSGGSQKQYGMAAEFLLFIQFALSTLLVLPADKLSIALPFLPPADLPSPSNSTSTNSTSSSSSFFLNSDFNVTSVPNSTLADYNRTSPLLPVASNATINDILGIPGVQSAFEFIANPSLPKPGFYFQPVYELDHLWGYSACAVAGCMVVIILLMKWLRHEDVSKSRTWSKKAVGSVITAVVAYKAVLWYMMSSDRFALVNSIVALEVLVFLILALGFYKGFTNSNRSFRDPWVNVGGAVLVSYLYSHLPLLIQNRDITSIALIAGGAASVLVVALVSSIKRKRKKKSEIDSQPLLKSDKYLVKETEEYEGKTEAEEEEDQQEGEQEVEEGEGKTEQEKEEEIDLGLEEARKQGRWHGYWYVIKSWGSHVKYWYKRVAFTRITFTALFIGGVVLLCTGYNQTWHRTTVTFAPSLTELPCGVIELIHGPIRIFFEFTASALFR